MTSDDRPMPVLDFTPRRTGRVGSCRECGAALVRRTNDGYCLWCAPAVHADRARPEANRRYMPNTLFRFVRLGRDHLDPRCDCAEYQTRAEREAEFAAAAD